MIGQQTHHHNHHSGQKSIQNERNSLGRPQLFVQLTFGVSWSDRHIPQSHTFSYTSKNLKSARDSGHFPRQAPPSQQHRRQDASQPQYRGERHHRDHERPRSRPSNSRSRHVGAQSPPRESRSGSRRPANERGSSAPPPTHNSPWNDEEGGPSATLFPRPARATMNSPFIWKDLPTNPARFRLGEDGLPWSASAWPFDPAGDEDGDEPPFANLPTVVPLSPPNGRRSEDPQRVRELESLSMAMMTVDNGFENQWWNQGERESVAWFPSDPDKDDGHPMSIDDAALLSAAEPPSGVETYSPNSESFRGLVSPLSDSNPSVSIPGPLQRSCTSRSDDELWMGR
ncbi:hypothetical protein HD806DRAFT_300765 [Xylariaceae sp. AK1471]|nr:hypothetical protein HD806DRAFT_300765 [Xylariaceae sp. AK1471]